MLQVIGWEATPLLFSFPLCSAVSKQLLDSRMMFLFRATNRPSTMDRHATRHKVPAQTTYRAMAVRHRARASLAISGRGRVYNAAPAGAVETEKVPAAANAAQSYCLRALN